MKNHVWVYACTMKTIAKSRTKSTALNVLPGHDTGEIFKGLQLSETSEESYRTALRNFARFIAKQDNPTPTRGNILSYRQHLLERHDISASTKQLYLSVTKTFLRELHALGTLSTDPTRNIRGIKVDRKHKRRGMTVKEMDILGKYLEGLDPSEPYNARLLAIMVVLIFHGCRSIEIRRLMLTDYDVSGSLRIQQKGSHDRETLRLCPMVRAVINNHIKINKIKGGALLQSHSNSTTSADRSLTKNGLRRIIQKTLENAGVSTDVRRITPHLIRHGFVSRLAKKFKGDIPKVMQASRHKSMTSVQAYLTALSAEGIDKEVAKEMATSVRIRVGKRKK